MCKIFIISLILSFNLIAQDCGIFDVSCIPGGESTEPSILKTRAELGRSFPDNNSAASINPARINIDKGLGIETIAYKGDIEANFASGNGRIGSAFSSSKTDGTFFGNTTKESTNAYETRKPARDAFDKNKQSFAFAYRILRNKDDIFEYAFNIGYIVNYNKDTSLWGHGFGSSLTFGPLILSYSRQQDSYRNDNFSSEIEYYIDTYGFGLNIGDFSFDYIHIENNDNFNDKVDLITGTWFTDYFMLTAGWRKEQSQLRDYDYELKSFKNSNVKKELFSGIQFSAGPYFLIGFYYNYYLNRNGSVSLTFFF